MRKDVLHDTLMHEIICVEREEVTTSPALQDGPDEPALPHLVSPELSRTDRGIGVSPQEQDPRIIELFQISTLLSANDHSPTRAIVIEHGAQSSTKHRSRRLPILPRAL